MKSSNPTRLRIGMTGSLRGKQYRIAGRVVMGMEEGGVTYYWNEFHLVAAAGDEATLVFEETEQGPQWRLFIMFEPQSPMTAEDAAARQVGDTLEVEGTEVRVTLVDESRVYHIEGEAPEGVELGDVARYFNAEGPGLMLVVSWTGDEVECYEGWDLSAGTVKSAFNLTGDPAGGFASLLSRPGSAKAASWLPKVLLIFLLLGGGIFAVKLYSLTSAPGSTKLLKAPDVRPAIPAGSSLTLRGKAFRVVEHAVVEVATVGRRYERHEFRLDADDSEARLIFGLNPKTKDWYLFTPIPPQGPLTPEKAAAVQSGQTVALGLRVGTVTELFQGTVRKREGAEASDSPAGIRFFGFRAQSGSAEFLVEWNEAALLYYSGTPLAAKEVAASLRSTKK